jgi:trehalose/maltose hydrolase-like predicted phosphorylase
MYPSLLALQPAMANQHLIIDLIDCRKAKQKATVYGYKGAMFPWSQMIQEKRQRQLGHGIFEQHITADVS